MNLKTSWLWLVVATAIGGVAFVGCRKDTDVSAGGTTGSGSKAAVDIDGSSTVGPISAAIAEEFMKENPDAEVTVAESGTSGGGKKFGAGEIDIWGASRPITEEETALCKKNGIEWIELPVAFDGLSVVVNPKNTFIDSITTDELKKIWEPNSKVKTWADVRPGFPAEQIKLYGAGTDSGTFDYFTEEIVGEKGASRSDYQGSEDDNVLVQGVAGDEFSLGYFGYAYYENNKDKLKLLAVNGVKPSAATVLDGTYKPLSRPLFIYVNKKSLDEKPAVAQFVKYYLTKTPELIASVGYVALPKDIYDKTMAHFESKMIGPSNILEKK
ncbi:MAG: PstS family phosphate ABC transporter substrate-binding protein [Fimbriimonadaceae bacterium]